MKRKIFTLICSALVVSAVSAQQDSLIRFVGFDQASDTAHVTYAGVGNEASFSFGNSGKGKDAKTPTTGSAKIVATGGHNGTSYWQETVSGWSSNSNPWDNQFCVEMIPATDNTLYRATVWLKSDQATAIDSSINFTVGQYSYGELIRNGGITPPTTWTKYALLYYVQYADSLAKDKNGFTTGPRRYRLPFHAQKNGVLGYDDIKVERAGCGLLSVFQDTVTVDFGYSWTLDVSVPITLSAFSVSGTKTIAVTGAVYDKVNKNQVKLKLASIPSSTDTLYLTYNGGANPLAYAGGTGIPTDGNTRSFTKSPITNLNTATAINQPEIASIVVSPNPVQSILTVSNVNVNTIDIYNLTGQKVKSVRNTSQVDVSSLANGMYIINVNGVSTTKFVKK